MTDGQIIESDNCRAANTILQTVLLFLCGAKQMFRNMFVKLCNPLGSNKLRTGGKNFSLQVSKIFVTFANLSRVVQLHFF